MVCGNFLYVLWFYIQQGFEYLLVMEDSFMIIFWVDVSYVIDVFDFFVYSNILLMDIYILCGNYYIYFLI